MRNLKLKYNMTLKLIQLALLFTVGSTVRSVSGQRGINTPPTVSHNRNWRLSANEKIGSVVDRLVVTDVEGDTLTLSLSAPSSNILNDVEDGYKHFTIDDHMKVILTKSLRGLSGKTFLVGIKVSDGTITTRSDVKVTVTDSKTQENHASSFANAFAPRPSSPSLVANIPNGPLLDTGFGPPMIDLDQETILRVNSTEKAGALVHKVHVSDFSKTFVKLSVSPEGLVSVSDDGEITVAEDLTKKVGRHKIKITASNQYASITEFINLYVLGPGFSSDASPGDDREKDHGKDRDDGKRGPPDHKRGRPDGHRERPRDGPRRPPRPYPPPKVIIIKEDTSEGISTQTPPSAGKRTLVISLIIFSTILSVLLVGLVIFHRRKRNALKRNKKKSISVEYRGKEAAIEMPEGGQNDRNLFRGFLQAVGFQRAVSNKYVETKNSKNLANANGSCKYRAQAPPADEWEFPRHKLRFVDILGEGCFGQVWKCETQLQEGETSLVAVKTLKEPSGPDERRDLLQEMKVFKSLGKHPNVVSFLGCCTDKDPIFMIIEYMVGGTLQNYLRNSRTSSSYNNLHGPSGSLTPRDLTIFALQIAKGMDFLSKNFIIHRDLAARNVLVGEGKVCKVADFGFARDVANNYVYERKSDGRLPIRWMAPESLFDNIFTSQSDVWSFGVLLWEIVTLGSTPYPGKSASEVASCVKAGYRLEKPPHCHREIYNIMYYCWDATPKERLTFGELTRDLDALISKEVDYIALDNFPDRDYYNFNTSSASGELL